MERTRTFLMDPAKIGFFKAILESYEEVAIMTVLDGRRGKIDLIYPVSSEEVLEGIMADMKRYDIQFTEAADV
jgi:hypothetical protein